MNLLWFFREKKEIKYCKYKLEKYYNEKEKAEIARLEADVRYGFSPHHGKG